MATFVIQGGKKLAGTIRVGGSKNAAGPILAATTLIEGTCILRNMPRIADIETLLEILKSMGAQAEWLDDHSLSINCATIDPRQLNQKLVSKIRLSILLLGCLAQRFSKISLPVPGGCNIGSRPLDAHFDAMRELGYRVTAHDDEYIIERIGSPKKRITLTEMSVTATENSILASVLGDHSVVIQCAAAEPHVQDLCRFLVSAGASVEGIGTHALSIRGVPALRPVEYTIIPDSIEVGTFMVLAAVTRSPLAIENASTDLMPMEMKKFEEAGVLCEYADARVPYSGAPYSTVTIRPKKTRSLRSLKKLHCMPYPGFAADLLQPFTLMMTQAEGISLIHDWMYDGRLRYVSELQKMGANINVLDPHRILIVGPTPLYAKEITSYDLRAGATLIIGALLADGTTKVSDIEQVDRGYEALDVRLRALGASIERAE